MSVGSYDGLLDEESDEFGIDFSQDTIGFLTSRVLKFSDTFEALKHQFNLPSDADYARYLFGCEWIRLNIGNIEVPSCES